MGWEVYEDELEEVCCDGTQYDKAGWWGSVMGRRFSILFQDITLRTETLRILTGIVDATSTCVVWNRKSD